MIVTDATKVRFLAVVGLSAAGKSSVAHNMAQQLRSPFHPISADSYYHDQAVCDAVGSYDDCRSINYDALAADLETIRRVVSEAPIPVRSGEGAVSAAWHSWVHEHLPDTLVGHLIPLVPEEAAENHKVEGTVSDGDESLYAHEAEDHQRRVVTSEHFNTHSSLHSNNNDTHNCTVDVICEGFALFCAVPSHSLHSLFAHCVWVDCDVELACVRRFLRTPRRHKSESNYKGRIELMWASRTQARCLDLQRAVVERLQEETNAVPLTLIHSFYSPPRPASSTLWSSSGAAAPDFRVFWESEYNCTHVKSHITESGSFLQDTRCTAEVAERVCHHIAAQKGIAVTDTSAVAELFNRYCEFRYWYMFEVYFYFELFRRCQEQRCSEHGIPVSHVANSWEMQDNLAEAVTSFLINAE